MVAVIQKAQASRWLFRPIAIGGPLIDGSATAIEAILSPADQEFVTDR